MKLAIVILAGLVALSCSTVMVDRFDHEEARSVVMDAQGISWLEVESSAGSLVIEGRAGLQELQIEGTAYASSEDILAEVEIVAKRDGNRALVAASLPDGLFQWYQGAKLDMKLLVPDTLEVEVEDGSGAMKITGVASLSVFDGSGSIAVEEVAGDVFIEDGSGSIDVHAIQGVVTVEDGSGGISISDVDGSVVIKEDGSGSISVRGIEQDVKVEDDGSGSIEVAGVGGDFIVLDDGSGSIRHQDVRGRVQVPD